MGLKEEHEETGESFEYETVGKGSTSHFVRRKKRKNTQATTKRGNIFWNFFKAVFLPVGYPHTVSLDYGKYQFYDTIQALCSSIFGLLSTRSVLAGLGVGQLETTTLAATIIVSFRNISGRLGGVVFAWLRGTRLDSDSKKWRIRADILNDFAHTLDICSEVIKGWSNTAFLIISTFSTILLSIVGVAGSATRSVVAVHQAISGNSADIAAKDSSQETAVNIIGLLVGMLLLRFLSSIPSESLQLFLTSIFVLVLIFGHLFANHMAVKSLILTTINDQRCSILCNSLVKNQAFETPLEVSQQENNWTWNQGQIKVSIGVSLSKLIDIDIDHQHLTLNDIKMAAEHGETFFVSINKKLNHICVVLLSNDSKTLINASFTAYLLRSFLLAKQKQDENIADVIVNKTKSVIKSLDIISELESKGWDLSHFLVLTEGFHITLAN